MSTATAFNATSTADLIDRFGVYKARIAGDTETADGIKAELIDRLGEAKAEGELFRVSIAHTLTQRPDWRAIALALADKLHLKAETLDALIAEHTNATDAWVVRCTSRNGRA